MNPEQVMSSGPYNVEENYQQYKTYSISFYFKMFEWLCVHVEVHWFSCPFPFLGGPGRFFILISFV